MISKPSQHPEADPSTLSNYAHFDVQHTALNLDVDFAAKIVSGDVLIRAIAKDTVDHIVLDTSFLTIKSVTVNGTAAQYALGPRVEALGSALEISTPQLGGEVQIYITFETTDKCTALQFLGKENTDSKTHPYLFSQSEPIHSRSFFPCFDTPSSKCTYDMTITSPLNCVMSGVYKSEKKLANGTTTYTFEQPIPIPSYLVALASGNFKSLDIGPRSKVYCEEPKLAQCQQEFAGDVEKFIEAAEKIVFDYEWLVYNILILPDAFPYGGMEIPNITFATPTIVVGDKSNIDVVAHELAHSWSGNLVTNSSWEHFWLNEGWCVYLERKILGHIHGAETRDFACILGWYDLENSIKAMGKDADRFSSLYHDLKDGSDPDDAFSVVPYEKGSTLLYYLETLLGASKFDSYVPFYFNKFKYKSLDTYQFVDSIYEYFADDKAVLDTVDWDKWIFQPGMPPIKPKFNTKLADEVYKLADRWLDAIKQGDFSLFCSSDIVDFSSNQSVVFLETLSAWDKLEDFKWTDNIDVLEKLDALYGEAYGGNNNAEILSRWYLLQLSGKNMKFYDVLGEWLGTVGRMKFVRPGYVILNKIDHERAVEFYERFESTYHPICRAMVRKDLHLD